MYLGFYKENDKCLECKEGRLRYSGELPCVCCTITSCLKCVKKNLVCTNCGFEVSGHDYNDVFGEDVKKEED